jgi:uridine kinase
MLTITCKNNGKEYEVPINSTLEEFYEMTGLHTTDDPALAPVCARVNNKVEGMHFRIYKPKQVEFLTIKDQSAMRAYTRSLFFVLCKAVHDLYPEVSVVIDTPVSNGYFCRIEEQGDPHKAPEQQRSTRRGKGPLIKQRMQEIIDAALPIHRHEVPTEEAIRLFTELGTHSKVKLLESLGRLYTLYYEIDGYVDYYYGALLTNTSQLYLFGLEEYYDGLLLRVPSAADPHELGPMVRQDKMFDIFQEQHSWQRILGISTVGQFNEAVQRGFGKDIIHVSEALQEKKIAEIARTIATLSQHARHDTTLSRENRETQETMPTRENRETREAAPTRESRETQDTRLRLVLIAGPSSSGKTTTCKRICVQLLANGIHPVSISLDDYFVDREKTPRDETGDYDFESLYALNLPLLNDHLQRLFRGEEVQLPRYDFPTGTSMPDGKRLRLHDNEVLVMEGIHALNPELTAQIPEGMKYRIYASALTTILLDTHNYIPTTDNRLLRRIIRDYKYRGCSAQETIRRWPSVRRGENKWIFPYQENADVMFNTAMLYELAVIKQQAEPVLEEVPENCEEYAEAYRLRKFLHYIKPLSADSLPPTSLLREFLGGSSFDY